MTAAQPSAQPHVRVAPVFSSRRAIRPGVTTDEIDRVVHDAAVERNAYPSPLNYFNFPKSVCTSVNEVICHGIPDKRELEDGDIVNVDVTIFREGMHGDLNETFVVGKPSEQAKNLVKCAHDCLQKAIAMVKPGTRYRDIGDVITKHAKVHHLSATPLPRHPCASCAISRACRAGYSRHLRHSH